MKGKIGLTPQLFSPLGACKSKGLDAEKAITLVYQAIALEKAGC